MLAAANQNSCRRKKGYRYDDEMKQYASYLRMIIGPMAYETIQKNLEAAIPALPSTNRYIRSSNCHIVEGVLRCDELLVYLQKRKFPFEVSLSEDGTRIVDKVQYDSVTNQLIGFMPPINKKNGMPIPFNYPARNAAEIVNHFSNQNETSSFLNIVMAQPLRINCSGFAVTR